VNYEKFKEEAKNFIYGGSIQPKNPEIVLQKCDKCKKELKYLKNLESYNNLIKGGMNHCEDCGFDLC